LKKEERRVARRRRGDLREEKRNTEFRRAGTESTERK
jgi:hypothetical protein